ncbi:alpha-(1,3)-fucosyltransferase C-like [Palaemon carinicauda]|uniref:alpha-(1,3)-fucosyltransferase C-like n=1 Tax=Palaemon carinicauda TaxID=392227 RepID=UPI0035B5C421
MNKDNAKLADAIVFSSTMVSRNHIPTYRRPDQRWVWVNVEAPRASPAHIAFSKLNRHHLQSHFNWTMTYHSNADIVAFYGYLISKGEETLPLRPNLMSEHPNAMKKYMESLSKSTTLEDIMGPSWKDFVSRPKLVAWMSGHCGTLSRREQYVNELANYIPVDKFGRCGTKPCQPVKDDGCWKDILGPGYLFYMSFENDLCNEYITEKLYFALTYNLVPIVWGGSNYSRFLPPGSYINGRHYHPKDLASLLLRLQSDPVAYGRYHVWRGFWTPNMRGSMCELCHKLHTDKETKYYTDIKGWRVNNNKCIISPRWLFKDKNGWKIVIKPQQNGTSYGNF